MRQWCLQRQTLKASRQRMQRSAWASGTQTAAVKVSTVSLGFGASTVACARTAVEEASSDAGRATVVVPGTRGRSVDQAGSTAVNVDANGMA